MDKYADWDGLQPVHAAGPEVAPGVSVRQRRPAQVRGDYRKAMTTGSSLGSKTHPR
jgi:hypothetical protein